MKVRTLLLCSSVAALVCAASTLMPLPAMSKVWTVEQRQAKLMQDVNAGQKSGKLTAQESKKLRKRLSNVARKKTKMLQKSNGKLTTSDKTKLQDRIDKTSDKIKLEKAN
jgi:hypothetical protein